MDTLQQEKLILSCSTHREKIVNYYSFPFDFRETQKQNREECLRVEKRGVCHDQGVRFFNFNVKLILKLLTKSQLGQTSIPVLYVLDKDEN